ncbi:DUF2064 domain-containing protein [candidate division KSB1 bacterium]|nr:DUF2064 domain-containing protein [candidate division KSB1 bacterium]
MANSAGDAVATAKDAVACIIHWPERGAVLPMFAETAGEEQALIAAESLLVIADRLLNSLPVTTAIHVSVDRAVDEPELRRFFGPRVTALTTAHADVGERIRAMSREMLVRGVSRLVITVAECPWLTKLHLIQAFLALKGADLVLGPASNGGLYLLGLSAPLSDVFEQVNWDSRFFMDDVRDLLRARNSAWTEVAPQRIVETQADWDDYQRSLRG